jgi:predicted RNase H-like HicB family nuclease
MLTEYIQAAMRRAKYELLGDGTFFGEIPDCQGVWGNADTLKACQEDLQDALEGWIVLGLRLGHSLPVIDDIDLTPALVPLEEEQEVA